MQEKVVIWCGGMGTRLSEETDKLPKPMVEICGKPILWHIMKYYSFYGFNEFILLVGYKQKIIKDYFLHYYEHNTDLTIDLEKNNIEYHKKFGEDWKITILDTGETTQTGSRLLRAKEYLNNRFLLTYGDGLCSVNIPNLISFHEKHKGILTLTSIQPQGKYGNLEIDKYDRVIDFQEKPKGDGRWVNGGYMICEPELFDYILEGDFPETLKVLVNNKKLISAKFDGFWAGMDTLYDKTNLELLWNRGEAPWKVW